MKKQMLPFLTEWLIKYGTTIVDINKFESFPLSMLLKATRLGYLTDVSIGHPMLMKLTKKGITYLQENQK